MKKIKKFLDPNFIIHKKSWSTQLVTPSASLSHVMGHYQHPYLSIIGWRQDISWTCHHFIIGLSIGGVKQPWTLTWFRATDKPNLYVFGLSEEARGLCRNPHRKKDNMQTLKIKAPARNQTCLLLNHTPRNTKKELFVGDPFQSWPRRGFCCSVRLQRSQ